jgi:hypothetical protein
MATIRARTAAASSARCKRVVSSTVIELHEAGVLMQLVQVAAKASEASPCSSLRSRLSVSVPRAVVAVLPAAVRRWNSASLVAQLLLNSTPVAESSRSTMEGLRRRV